MGETRDGQYPIINSISEHTESVDAFPLLMGLILWFLIFSFHFVLSLLRCQYDFVHFVFALFGLWCCHNVDCRLSISLGFKRFFNHSIQYTFVYATFHSFIHTLPCMRLYVHVCAHKLMLIFFYSVSFFAFVVVVLVALLLLLLSSSSFYFV